MRESHWYSPNMFTCYTMYTIDVNIHFLLSIFFIYKIYKILYYTLYIMYTENYMWNYISSHRYRYSYSSGTDKFRLIF